MTPDNKPREFWIDKRPRPIGYEYTVYEFEPDRQTIHTREILPNEASELATLKQRLADAEEVLKFIAANDIAPSKIKHEYIDQAYAEMALEYFKRKEGGGE